VKVTFTIAIAALAYIVYLCFGDGEKGSDKIDYWTRRSSTIMIGFSFAGGIVSSLTGSGVSVFLFFFVVAIAGLHPKVAVPTGIVAMAIVSALGVIMLGLIDGQLNVGLRRCRPGQQYWRGPGWPARPTR
jgi:uncharacterized membrane protein YfcA